MAQTITIYTTRVCPFCDRAKALLKSLGLEYTEIGLESDPDLFRTLSAENNGWRTVPMIFVGKRFIGGFDDLSALHRKGEFLPLVQAP
jgi:glutaredoxin 3